MSFEQLKQRSQNKDALIEKLSSLDNSKEKKSYKDDRFWRPTVDDSGTASAIIRFLPECENEEDAAVLYFSHAFQGPGGWFIENSRTTFGEKDPCVRIQLSSLEQRHPSQQGYGFTKDKA